FHFLRLTKRLLGLLAGFVFGIELPRAFLDRSLERLGELAQLEHFALALRDVDADADDPDGLSRRVVEGQAPRMDPAQLVVALPYDAELKLEFRYLLFKGGCDRVAQADRVVAINGGDPAVVTPVECRKPVHGLGGR